MTAKVTLHVSCDAWLKKSGSSLKRRCPASASFEAPNIRDAKIAAEEAGWAFTLDNSHDKVMCNECGPEIKPYMYGRRRE